LSDEDIYDGASIDGWPLNVNDNKAASGNAGCSIIR
jgi:hypothetical protein